MINQSQKLSTGLWLSQMGTRLMIALFARFVGTDEMGNRYYQTRAKGSDRRFVRYVVDPDPSRISPLWFSWLHHTKDELPTSDYFVYPWVMKRVPNQTGTLAAFCLIGDVEKKQVDKIFALKPWAP